jgi:hypothetical protein
MNLPFYHQFVLLAQQLYWERLGDRFRGGYADFSLGKIVATVAVVALFGIGVYLLRRYAHERPHSASFNSPPELFRELCRAHRLDFSQRRLLKRLAAAWDLASPAFLFVEPNYFETTKLPAEWEHDTLRVEKLRARLFAKE